MNAAKYTLLMCNDCHSTSQSVRKSSAPSELHYFLRAFHDASKYRSNTWIVCLRFQINWPMIIPMRKHCVRFACTFICTVWCKIYVVIMSERRRAGRFDQRQSVNRVHSVWKHHCGYLHCAMHNSTCAWIDEMERFRNVFKWNFVEPYDYISNTQWMDGWPSEWASECVFMYVPFKTCGCLNCVMPCHAIHVRFVFALQSISSYKPNTHTLTHSVAHKFLQNVCVDQFFSNGAAQWIETRW